MSVLFLGPIAFADFEIPGRIVFGGRQRLAIHSLPGGGRVIDAMGRDDAPLAWTGAFSGPEAAPRALQLDLMRAQGLVLPLTWDVLSYLVVISEFAASYERGNWIPYRIVCSVVADSTATLVEAGLSTVASTIADLTTASGFGNLAVLGPAASLATASAAGPGSASYSAALAALGNAAETVTSGIAKAGLALGAAADFPSAATAAQQLAELSTARGYVLRAQANFAGIES